MTLKFGLFLCLTLLGVSPLQAQGTITTVVGSGTQGFSGAGGLATSAKLNGPAGVVMTGAGNFLFADRTNMRIRGVTGGIITTVASNGMQGFSGDGGPSIDAAFSSEPCPEQTLGARTWPG